MSNVITPVKTDERSKLGIRAGDTVRVHQRIIERGKTRVQTFEGLVIAVKHGTEAGGTFTVRTTLSGVGVERILPLYAPFIEEIEIVRRSKVRRAKLYFIREKVARDVRRQLRNMRMVNISSTDFAEEEVPVTDEGTGAEEEVVVTTEVNENAESHESNASETPVEEVMEKDPAQTPSGEEMSPAEEAAGEPEAPEVEETEAAPAE